MSRRFGPPNKDSAAETPFAPQVICPQNGSETRVGSVFFHHGAASHSGQVGLSLKRIVDVVGSAAGLLALFPFLLILAIAIRASSAGPIFYVAQRIGRNGHSFRCYKFRSMVREADQLKGELRSRNERQGALFKMSNDPRRTPLGRWMRRYSIDELPQLWNVLRGEMSLVGPRPASLDDYALYERHHLRRLKVKPGLTGLWQVSARDNPSFDSYIALDLEYIESRSVALDLKILLKTVPAVLRGTGV